MNEDPKQPGKKPKDGGQGLSRRGFLTSMGTGAVGVAVVGRVPAEPQVGPEVVVASDLARVTLQINGQPHRLLVESRWSLAYVLREELGLTGTKVGCDRGECGACTVLMDDVPRYACLTLAVEAEGTEIETVEGLMSGEELGSVQEAFVEEDAFQCAYCTSGQIMTAEGLLRANSEPTLDEVQHAMSGNLCRCGTYPHIFAAVQRAAQTRRGQGGAS
jgi:xanthine dehydrogenase YagT iron-sulfur-binding subunit